jgi:hypothetical protein
MTITATERKAGPYVGNGSLAQYSFAFKAANPNHLQVVEADAAGVETTLVHVTNYTVALNPNQTTSPGGTITRKAGNLPAGYRWTILSLVPYEQPIDLPPGGAFSAEVVEFGLDNLAVQVQQAVEQVGRAVLVPATSDTDPQDLVAGLVAAGAGSADNAAAAAASAAAAAAAASAAAVGNGGRYSATVGGAANAIVLTPSPALASYVAGEAITFIVANANTGAVTVDVSGLGAKSVTKAGTVAMAPGELVAGQLVTLRYDGTRYQLVTPAVNIVSAPPALRLPHTWAIPGEIKVAVGDTDFIVPFFVPVPAGRFARIVGSRYKINSGTSVTFSVTKAAANVTGLVGLVATSGFADTTIAPVDCANGNQLALVVSAVSGTPKNLTVTLYIDYGVL